MEDKQESVVGEIPIVAPLRLGSQHLTLMQTETRIIFVHVGKRGAGALASRQLLGALGGGFEGLLKAGKESLSRPRHESVSPQAILASNPDNFAIGLDEIVRVDVEETARHVSVTILTRDEKFEFSARLGFDRVVELLGKALGDRLVSHRLNSVRERIT